VTTKASSDDTGIDGTAELPVELFNREEPMIPQSNPSAPVNRTANTNKVPTPDGSQFTEYDPTPSRSAVFSMITNQPV